MSLTIDRSPAQGSSAPLDLLRHQLSLARLAAATRRYDPHGVLQAGAYTRAAAA